jgi:hypothetical protein
VPLGVDLTPPVARLTILAKLETEITISKEIKPLNFIVLTDNSPSDDVKSVLLSATKKLNKFNILLY